MNTILALASTAVVAAGACLYLDTVSPATTKAKDHAFVAEAEAMGWRVELDRDLFNTLVMTCTRAPSSHCGDPRDLEGGIPKRIVLRLGPTA